MNPVRPTWLFVLCLVLVAGGCSTVSTFDRSQTTLEPNDYVAAFSFDTTALADWPFDSAMVDLRNGPPIVMAGNESGVTMVVFQMSQSTLKLGDLIFSREEYEGTRVYESTVVGPKVKLHKGSVTYIGSLVVDDILRDEETGSPLALRLRIVDSWESNEFAWESMFPVFEARSGPQSRCRLGRFRGAWVAPGAGLGHPTIQSIPVHAAERTQYVCLSQAKQNDPTKINSEAAAEKLTSLARR